MYSLIQRYDILEMLHNRKCGEESTSNIGISAGGNGTITAPKNDKCGKERTIS